MPRYNNRSSSSHSNRSNGSNCSRRSGGRLDNRPQRKRPNRSGGKPDNRQRQQNKNKFCTFCSKIGKNPNGHYVKECQELKSIECKNCNEKGHTLKYCPYIEKCKFCQRVGHTDEKCFYNPKNKIPKCSECKRFGHTYEECYYVSSEEKKQFIQEKEKRKEEEKQKDDESKKHQDELREQGITHGENYIRFCKEQFKLDKNFKPWIIYMSDNEEDSDNEEYFNRKGLTKTELRRLDQIKIQIELLDEMDKKNNQ